MFRCLHRGLVISNSKHFLFSGLVLKKTNQQQTKKQNKNKELKELQ